MIKIKIFLTQSYLKSNKKLTVPSNFSSLDIFKYFIGYNTQLISSIFWNFYIKEKLIPHSLRIQIIWAEKLLLHNSLIKIVT